MLPIFIMLKIQYILRVDTSVMKLQQVNAKAIYKFIKNGKINPKCKAKSQSHAKGQTKQKE